jgi:hypothetical protein
VFEGTWVNGLLSGQGTCVDASGKYEGSWLQGLRHGHGVLTKNDGESYDGEWR